MADDSPIQPRKRSVADDSPMQPRKRYDTPLSKTNIARKKTCTFKKRPGTVNVGKEYEKLMCGLYALKLSLLDDVVDFEMTSNNENCGDFDDIEIKVLFRGEIKRRFLFQLKHKDNPQVLKEEHFVAEKKDFSAQKYFKSISEIKGKTENDVFILYTNNKVDLKNHTDLTNEIQARPCNDLEYVDILLNTSKRSESTVLEFTSKTKKSMKFYLFTQQYNAGTVEHKLKEMLRVFLKCDVYASLAHYLNKWWSQNYVLTKHDFIAKLTELAFSPFISCLSNIKANEKTESLKQAIRKFELTIVENGTEDFIKDIWNVEENEDFKDCIKQFVLPKSDEFTTSKILWYLDKAPLIVMVDHKNQTTIESVLKVWGKDLQKNSIILFGKVTKEDLHEWNVFESLRDLSKKCIPEDVYSQIIENFKISFQGRSEISLRQLTLIDEDLARNVKTKELFEMSQQKCYVIGHEHTELPEFHVARSVFFSQSDEAVQEKEIFDNLKSNMNVFCAPAGMGKSRMMHVLSHNYCPSDCWAIHISLINYNPFFARCTESHTDNEKQMNDIMKTFLNLDNEEECEDPVTQGIKEILVRRKKVHIFLDGLDEVDNKHVKLVMKCAQHMMKKGLNVWISSRENLLEELRQTLNIEPMEIQELDQKQQESYLREKLQSQYEESKIETILKAVFKSVDVINSQQLLGIPLQLHIITEIFLRNKGTYEEVEKQNMFVLTRMYKIFFGSKVQFKHDKLGIDEHLRSQLGISFKYELEQYEIPALFSCLEDEDIKKLQINESKKKEFLNEISAHGDKNGIIKSVDQDGNAIFEHKSFAEYFACVWLKRNNEKVMLLKKKFFTPRYDNLRKIFDIMMAESNPLHLAVIYQNQFEIQKHLSTKFEEEDEGGRSAFHLACSYGNFVDIFVTLNIWSIDNVKHETNLYLEIIDRLKEKCKNLRQRDRLFQLDCVEYSLYRGSFYPLEKLAEKNLLTFEEIEEKINLHDVKFSTFAIYIAFFGYNNLLIKMLEQKPQMVKKNIRLSVKNTYLLHIAIKGCTRDDCTKPREENIKAVKIILDKLEDINDMYVAQEDLRFNPLEYAYYNGCYHIIEMLTQKGAKCSDENTILHHIARKQEINENVLQMVKKYDVNLNARNNKGQTALYLACENESYESMKILLENGASVTFKDDMNNTLLHFLMLHWDEKIDMVKLLITHGVDVSAQNKQGQNALHLASNSSFFESAKILLENGVDATIKDDMGNTPLHFLMHPGYGNTDMVKLLITNGVDVGAQNKEGQNALHLASKNGFLESAKILLGNGVDATIKDDMDNTPLHFLMQHWDEKIDMVKLLITNGVDVSAQNKEGQNALHLASKSGFLESAKILLANGVDATIKDDMDNTPLHFLMQQWDENTDMVKLLITNGVDVSAQNKEGQNALHLASKSGFFESGKILLENGVDATIKDDMNNTPLHFLMQHWDEKTDMLKFLITKGVDVNAQNKQGQNALHLASKNGLIECAKILLANGGDASIKDDRNNTPLHFLMQHWDEKIDMVKFLISNGIDVNAQNKQGQNALHLASKNDFLESAKILLENGADATIKDDMDNTSLHFLMQRGDEKTDMVKLLTTSGVDVSAQNKEGQNALHLASKNGFFESAKILLENGVDATIRDNMNNTPLHFLMQHWDEKTDMVLLLITNGVDCNAQNKEGQNTLHLASKNGLIESAKILLANGVDVSIKDDMDNTPLHFLMQHWDENTDMVNLLITSGVDVNAQDKNRKTALHFAIQNGFLQSAKILLSNKADVKITDKDNSTAFHYLMEVRNYDFELAELLINKGLSPNSLNTNGQTPLHCACISGRLENVEFLHRHNADFTIVDNEDNTSLHYASMCELDNGEVIDFLLRQGFDINARNGNGFTPVHSACSVFCLKNVQHLHRRNSDLTIADNDGNTLLHRASQCCDDNFDTINFLLQQKLNINSVNNKGQAPLLAAFELGCVKNIKFLCEKGADLTITDNNGMSLIDYVKKLEDSDDKKTLLGYFKKKSLELHQHQETSSSNTTPSE